MTRPTTRDTSGVTNAESTGRLRIDEVGRALLVSVGGAHGACAAVASQLPDEPGRISVVLPDAALALRPELAHRLRHWVPMQYESVRLVAAGAASPTDGRSPALALCERLEAEVIAPDGELAAVPGGSLFVAPLRGQTTAGWWRFRPGRPAEAGGRRYPTPAWERGLSALAEVSMSELAIEEIPAGLWVRWPGHATPPDDLAFAIPMHPTNIALVVSRAGDPPLRTGPLRRLLEVMPDSLRDRLVVIPYGDRPVADGALGAVVSLAANRALRVHTGLPLRLSGMGPRVVAVDADGTPAWLPFAREIAWRPHGGARVQSWTAPADQLLASGPGQFMLNERWLAEILEAGLWIREIDRTDGAALPRQLPLDARHCTVVIGVCDARPGTPPWRLVERLLSSLPDDARQRLRVAVPAAAGQRFAQAAAQSVRRVVPDAPVAVLTPNGELVPWHGIHAPPPVRLERTEANDRAGAVDEATRLLSFVEEIRRMPAWDELPDESFESVAPSLIPAAIAPRAPMPEAPVPPPAAAQAAVTGNTGNPIADPADVVVPDAVIGKTPAAADLGPVPLESRGRRRARDSADNTPEERTDDRQ